MFEAVDIFLSVSQIMHENLQADSLDLCPAYSLKRSLDQTSCLTTAFVKNFSRVRAVLCSFVLMKETWGEKKLRLVKEKQTSELKKRTAARLAELRAVSTGVATDIEENGDSVQRLDSLPQRLSLLFSSSCCEPTVSTVAIHQEGS